jgi:hypothetical protein
MLLLGNLPRALALVSVLALAACSSGGGGSSSGSSSGSSGSGSSGGSGSNASGGSSTVGGTSGGSSGAGTTGEEDAGLTCPQPAGSCTPCPGQAGNAINVGQYCTKGGNQCPFLVSTCAADEPGGEGQNYCVVIVCPTFPDGGYNCGANACCYGEAGNPIHACVPSLCVIVDGGGCPPPP